MNGHRAEKARVIAQNLCTVFLHYRGNLVNKHIVWWISWHLLSPWVSHSAAPLRFYHLENHMHRHHTVFPRLVSACLRSLSTCLQRNITCQQKCILSDNVLDVAIDRRLGINKMCFCMVLPLYTYAINRDLMHFKYGDEYLVTMILTVVKCSLKSL